MFGRSEIRKTSRAVTSIEYGIITALISLSLLVILSFVGKDLSGVFDEISVSIGSVPNNNSVIYTWNFIGNPFQGIGTIYGSAYKNQHGNIAVNIPQGHNGWYKYSGGGIGYENESRSSVYIPVGNYKIEVPYNEQILYFFAGANSITFNHDTALDINIMKSFCSSSNGAYSVVGGGPTCTLPASANLTKSNVISAFNLP